jgi:CheY-like chemotaxis protein
MRRTICSSKEQGMMMTTYVKSVHEWVCRRFTPAQPQRPYRVLVVDDEPDIRNFVARVVRGEGFEIETASDGVEGLKLASAKPFDLVLTDLMMPNMTGDTLARHLRAGKPELPVLYLTGFSDKLFASRMILGDNEAFLDKPCTLRGLREAVWLAVSGHLPSAVIEAVTVADVNES